MSNQVYTAYPDSTGVREGYVHSMSSFAGSDIRAVLGGVEIGEIQQVSWSIMREKGGNFVLGDENARSFSRGRRYIAGALMFGFFSRDAVLEAMKQARAAGVGSKSAYMYFDWADKGPNLAEDSLNLLDQVGLGSLPELDPRGAEQDVGTAAARESLLGVGSPASPRRLTPVRYADQLLPFNITILAANEYGNHARMALLGVEIVNQESGFAIETMQADQRYTFVAREVLAWKKGQPSPLADLSYGVHQASLNPHDIVGTRGR